MAEKFDPAPPDKHAERAGEQKRGGKRSPKDLDEELKDSFPASDPPSATQPTE
jgi:hypothetical protein